MHFLDDPRHWIFLPEKVIVEVSADGVKYHNIVTTKTFGYEEHYEVSIKEFSAQNNKGQVRYIRVTATSFASRPEWRYSDKKKPMIACDEIYVQ
jgi:hypothetical protein